MVKLKLSNKQVELLLLTNYKRNFVKFNIYKLQSNACYVTDYRLTDYSLQITSSQTVDHPFKAPASVKPHGPTRVAQGIMT